jgi:hypothetical protein
MRDLQCVVDRFSLRQGDATHALAQGFAFEQFGDNVRRGIMRVDVVDNQDVRMI